MSITRDKVQVEIEFITDASKAFARTIQETERYRGELKKAQKEVADLAKEEERLAAKGKDATQVALKRAEAEARVSAALKNIAETGKQVEKIDLSKLLPSQLTARANQLRQSLQFIPDGHPARLTMEKDLQAINSKLAEMNGRTKATSGILNQMRETAKGVFLGGGLLGFVNQAIGGIKSLISSGLETAATFEQAKISFEVMLGSATKAQELIAKIQKLAANTPFETDELTDYVKRLLAMGGTAENVIPTMTALGNIAAGVGKEKLPQLVLAFGQVQAKTKLAGGELKQFVEAGVPLVAELAKSMGVAESSIFKMTEEGKISFKDVQKAIFGMSQEGGKFENLMSRQSKTLTGLWSTFKDNFTLNVLLPLGEFLSGPLKPIIEGLNYMAASLDSLSPKMDSLKKTTENEQKELGILVEKVTLYGKGTKERKAAIADLQRIYPDFFKNMDKEKVSNEELRGKLQEVNKQYHAKRLLIETNKVVEEYMNKEQSATDKLTEKQTNYAKQLVKAREIVKYYGDDIDILKQKLRAASDTFKGAYKDNDAQLYLQFIIRAANEQYDAESKFIEASQGVVRSKINAKKVNDELIKQNPALISAFKEIDDALNNKGTSTETKAGKPESDAPSKAEAKKRLDDELKRIQAAGTQKINALISENQQQGKIEKDYEDDILALKISGLQKELAFYQQHNKEYIGETEKTQIEILKLTIDRTEKANKRNLENLDIAANERITRLNLERATGLISEREANTRLLEITRGKLDEELNILTSQGKKNTDEYAKVLLKRAEVENQIAENGLKTLLDVEKDKTIRLLQEEELRYERGEVSEKRFKANTIQIQLDGVNVEIGILESKGEKETALYRTLNIKKLQLIKQGQQAQTDAIIDSTEVMNQAELKALSDALAAKKITQDQYDLALLEAEEAKYRKRLQEFKDHNLTLTDEYSKTQAKLTGVEAQEAKKREEIQRDEARKRTQFFTELGGAFKDYLKDQLDAEIDSLSKTEEEKKKNAEKIKKLRIQQVNIDTLSEVAKIWLHAMDLGPIAGPILAGIQTLFAYARGEGLKTKITNSTFAQGGFTGGGMDIRDNTGYKVAGVVHEGEYVLPKWMVENKKYQPTIQALEASRISGFALGGFVDTTPRLSGFNTPPQYNQQNDFDLKSLKEEFRLYAQKVDNWANTFSVKLPLNDLEKAQYQKSVDLKDAQF